MSLTDAQLALRRTGVTGTDIAAICGLSEFRSPLDVFLDKTGRAEPVLTTAAMKRGIYLEDGILRWYADEAGLEYDREISRPSTIVLAGNPRIMATPDALAEKGAKWGVEVKAPGIHAESGWGEPGTDQVPQAYLCQGVFEMAVLDVERVDFAALLGGELKVFPVKRNRKVEGHLIERALAFWRDHVEADKAPTPTWRPRDVEWLSNTFPKDTTPALEWHALEATEKAAVQDWLLAHEEAGKAKRMVEEYELRVKLALGESAGIVALPSELGVKRIDWKANATATPKWKGVAEALRDGKTWEDALAANVGSPVRPLVPRRMKSND